MTAPPAGSGPHDRARLELLGPPVLVGLDGTRTRLERHAAALLARLALDGRQSRSALAAWLWPNASAAQARNSLRQRLFRLRRAAGLDVVEGQDALALADGVEVDLAELDDLHTSTLQGPHAAARPFLAGLDYDPDGDLATWVDAARERVRRRWRDALAARAERHEAAREVALALPWAERLLADDPLVEHAHRRVMRLHYLRGDRAAALAAWEHCRQVLRRELDAAPDRETRALADAIVAAQPLTALLPARAAGQLLPVTVLRPPQVIGRDTVLAELAEAMAARRTVLLHGDPGIGKSRVLEAVAGAQPAMLATGAQAGDARVPYALLARIARHASSRWKALPPGWAVFELTRLVPALGPAPTARLDPLRLQQAFAAALAAWADDGLQGLVVDDLHHADEASLEALLALAGSGEPRLAWLLAVRTREMAPALLAWQAAADIDRVTTRGLERLDHAGIAGLLEALALARFDAARWSGPLARHSGGNPLFALETVRALIALGDAAPAPDATRLPVPAALDALLERRLTDLSPAALRLARVAALAGADFDADVAAGVLETHPIDMVEPWRELEAAQLLEGRRYTHDLIAEAVLRALPAGIAPVLHARLAATLQALARAPARIAPHWAAAEAWSRAGDTYAEAARDARRTSRRLDEVAMWEQAAIGHERAGRADRAWDARAESVESVILCRGIEAAGVLVDRLDADQRNESQRLRACTARAQVSLMAGRAAEGEAAARAALESATRLDEPWSRFEAARLLAVALAQSGRAGEALATIEPFREQVISEGNLEQRHKFWSDYAYALKAAQRASDTAHALRQAMASAEEAGDLVELATTTSNLALVEGNLGRVERALDHARRARTLSDPLGVAAGPPAGAIELYVSMHEGALGRYAESLAGFERARRCFADMPQSVWVGLAANHEAHVLIHLGQYARAGQLLEWEGAGTPVTRARRVVLRGRIQRAQGLPGGPVAATAQQELGGRDAHMGLLLALEATLERPPDEAVAACARQIEVAMGVEQIAIALRGRVLRLRAEVAGGRVQVADADDLAAQLAHLHPADTYLGEAWWVLVQARDALGDADGAAAALRHGWNWVVEGTLPNVPPAFRASFLDRNRVNRELLAAASRRLGLQVPAPTLTATGSSVLSPLASLSSST